MARTRSPERKQSFSTRISRTTLQQLDELVQRGAFPNRTAAIEAAVARLADDETERLEQRRRAVEATGGVLSIPMTADSVKKAEWDYLDWLGERLTRG
jgi:Arc/MetJ-type ribon-helix-helix transcriptional regulator